MSHFTVVYDACVLYPAPLRDLLVRLAVTGLFRARWTNNIHDEWMRNVLSNRDDIDEKVLSRTRQLMDDAVPDCLVSEYEPLIDNLELPDPDDRHVLAAAIRTNAEVIVTFNQKDFPAEQLERFDIYAQHPDEFISNLYDLSPQTVVAVAKRQRAALTNPPYSPEEFISTLQRNQLGNVASILQDSIDLI